MLPADHIVDSREWLETRLRFLRGVLADPPAGADVEAIKAEIAALERQLRPLLPLFRRLFRRPTRIE